ncbi:hypothetical protein ACFPRL_22290 [Pseudoclavibacter helvolus]
MAARTASRRASLTCGASRSTSDTSDLETPARSATSRIVTGVEGDFWVSCTWSPPGCAPVEPPAYGLFPRGVELFAPIYICPSQHLASVGTRQAPSTRRATRVA